MSRSRNPPPLEDEVRQYMPCGDCGSTDALCERCRADIERVGMNTEPASTGLVQYDEMCRAIAICTQVDEAKDIRDRAIALEKYYAQAQNLEAERQVCNVRLRAERRCGELLREMHVNGERASDGNPSGTVERADGSPPTLSDLGISRDQSSRFQQLADIPESEFEASLAAPEKPSTARILREHRKDEAADTVNKMDPDALWLWGRLRDFERHAERCDARALLGVMTPAMAQDVKRLAPIVRAYLEDL